MIQFAEHIFQMGWNHQLVVDGDGLGDFQTVKFETDWVVDWQTHLDGPGIEVGFDFFLTNLLKAHSWKSIWNIWIYQDVLKVAWIR